MKPLKNRLIPKVSKHISALRFRKAYFCLSGEPVNSIRSSELSWRPFVTIEKKMVFQYEGKAAASLREYGLHPVADILFYITINDHYVVSVGVCYRYKMRRGVHSL